MTPEEIRAAVVRDRSDMFYAGWEAGKAHAIPGRDETLAFLYNYTTPEGRISTKIDSFVDNLLEWLENWSDD